MYPTLGKYIFYIYGQGYEWGMIFQIYVLLNMCFTKVCWFEKK
jgi:hypothetical protein